MGGGFLPRNTPKLASRDAESGCRRRVLRATQPHGIQPDYFIKRRWLTKGAPLPLRLCFARLNRTLFANLVFMAGGGLLQTSSGDNGQAFMSIGMLDMRFGKRWSGGFFLQIQITIRVANVTRFSRCDALGGTLVEPFCKPSALIREACGDSPSCVFSPPLSCVVGQVLVELPEGSFFNNRFP